MSLRIDTDIVAVFERERLTLRIIFIILVESHLVVPVGDTVHAVEVQYSWIKGLEGVVLNRDVAMVAAWFLLRDSAAYRDSGAPPSLAAMKTVLEDIASDGHILDT